MKKTATVIVLLLVVSPWLLPEYATLTEKRRIPANAIGIMRNIAEKDLMREWWPGTNINDSIWSFQQGTYQYLEAYTASIAIASLIKDYHSEISIGVSGLAIDTTELLLTAKTQLSSNPYSRAIDFFSYLGVKNELRNLLDSTALYFSNPDNVYGYHIERQKVKDANLVSVKQVFSHPPSTEEIYAIVDRIKKFIAGKGAVETNAPMLNIYSEDGGKHLTAQVAIATDRELPTEGDFMLKQMLVNGNILVAQVQGGRLQVDSCLQAVEYFVKDQNMMSPAIAFQRLITNRMLEKDSSKWITTINYPIY